MVSFIQHLVLLFCIKQANQQRLILDSLYWHFLSCLTFLCSFSTASPFNSVFEQCLDFLKLNPILCWILYCVSVSVLTGCVQVLPALPAAVMMVMPRPSIFWRVKRLAEDHLRKEIGTGGQKGGKRGDHYSNNDK